MLSPHLKGVTNRGGIIDGLTLRQTMGWRNIRQHLAWLNCTAAKWPVTKCHRGHIGTCVHSQGGWTHKLTRYGWGDILGQKNAPQHSIFLYTVSRILGVLRKPNSHFSLTERNTYEVIWDHVAIYVANVRNFYHFPPLVGKFKPRSFTRGKPIHNFLVFLARYKRVLKKIIQFSTTLCVLIIYKIINNLNIGR